MSGTASAGEMKGLLLAVEEGVPSDVTSEVARRHIGSKGPLHRWIQLGLSMDLSQVDMVAVEALLCSKILKPVTTVPLPAIATFRAKDHFRNDRSGPVVIGYIGDNFRKAFLDGAGKVEADIAEATLRVHKLVKASVDRPFIAELGGEEVAETTLAQMYELMKVQGRGQQGILLTNGYANIFCVRGAKSALWEAHCSWDSSVGNWYINAYLVTSPGGWVAGDQILSR